MDRNSIVGQIGRGLMVLVLAVSVGSLTAPGTAYARHGNGAAIALGILGGALAGAAIASSNAPGLLRGATGLLLSLCAASLLCGAGARLFLRPAARCILSSGAILRAGVLLQQRLKTVRFPAPT
jgi:hypothetical protein